MTLLMHLNYITIVRKLIDAFSWKEFKHYMSPFDTTSIILHHLVNKSYTTMLYIETLIPNKKKDI